MIKTHIAPSPNTNPFSNPNPNPTPYPNLRPAQKDNFSERLYHAIKKETKAMRNGSKIKG